MKRTAAFILAFSLALLSGCSGSSSFAAPSVEAPPTAVVASSAGDGGQTDYPKRQIDLIVPYSAGGDTDVAARAVADYLSKEWNQPIVVINQSGAVATAKEVTRAEPDGYTVLAFMSGEASCHNANNITPTVDFSKDLTPLARITRFPIAFCVKADAPWKDFKEFSDWVVAHPEALTWGASSMTGPAAVIVADWCNAIGADFKKTRMVQADGAADGATKVAGGHIVTHIGAPKGFMSLVDAGKCRLIGMSPFRHEYYPEVQTAEEQGVAGLTYSNAVCLWMPNGVDSAIAAKWNAGIEKAFADPAFLANLEKIEAMGDYLNANETKEFIAQEIEQYTALSDRLGLRK